jgi:hypothetical protein
MPEKLTLDVGVLKLNALIAGGALYVSVAVLLAVSTGLMLVAVTTPNGVVVALTVCEMPFACTG